MISILAQLQRLFGRTTFFSTQGNRAKALAALALASGLSLSAHAQIGSGWTPTTENYAIQTSTNCTATPLPSGIGGVFSVPSGQGRAEFRFDNLSSTAMEQFQGNVTVNSLVGSGITMKQTFGPAPSTPWNLIAIKRLSTGTLQIYDVEQGTQLLKPYTLGSTMRINTIYNPNGGGSGVATVDVYINGIHTEQLTGTGPNYNKIGCYVSSSGTGPATFTWQNVLFWNGGSNVSTPVAVDTPSFSPVAGTYTGVQSVTLSTTTSGASIRYTTDGSTPSETTGTLYSGAISVNTSTATLNAIAYESGQTDSPVTTAAYTLNLPQAATPTFSPAAGTYTSPQGVTMSSTTNGATIVYTTDGSTPAESGGVPTGTSKVFSNFVTVGGGTVTLKAIAFASGASDSAVATAVYTISPAATPTFSPPAGTYAGPQGVTMSSTTSGATIVYTTDGSTPTESGGVPTGTSQTFSNFVTVGGGTVTLKAIAFATGVPDSAVATAIYTISPAATPTFSPPAGTYTSPEGVTMSSTTSGATIVYTTDGSTPTESGGAPTGTSKVFSNFVSVGFGTTTLKAIAFASGVPDSAVGTAIYTITSPAATPTFSPPAGSYTGTQSVAISSTTSSASIAYTTNGATPTESGGSVTNGALLSNGGSVSLSTSTTLKAMAFASGFTDSAVGTAAYAISVPIPTTPQIQGSSGFQQPALNIQH